MVYCKIHKLDCNLFPQWRHAFRRTSKDKYGCWSKWLLKFIHKNRHFQYITGCSRMKVVQIFQRMLRWKTTEGYHVNWWLMEKSTHNCRFKKCLLDCKRYFKMTFVNNFEKWDYLFVNWKSCLWFYMELSQIWVNYKSWQMTRPTLLWKTFLAALFTQFFAFPLKGKSELIDPTDKNIFRIINFGKRLFSLAYSHKDVFLLLFYLLECSFGI